MGVDVIQEPVEQFYGSGCTVRDPFGNAIRFLQAAEVVTSPPAI